MSTWLIEESGNPEDGYSWNLFECNEGRLTMRATLYDEKFGLKMKGAMDWLESLEDFQLNLPVTKPNKISHSVKRKQPTSTKSPAVKPRRKA